MKNAILILGFTAAAFAQQQTADTRPRLFIEERVRTGTLVTHTIFGTNVSHYARNVSQEVTANMLKKCGNAVVITAAAESANYRLVIYPGSTTLLNAQGDIIATFNGHFIGTVSKDVCGYFNGQH
jgi:hypothetical protein